MSNATITTLLNILIYISDSIFIGVKILTPIFFLLLILKVNFKKLDQRCLTISINSLILTEGILYLSITLLNILATMRSGDDSELNFMISVFTGKQWFRFQIPMLCYGILPHIFWNKKLRHSIHALLYMVLIWFAVYFFMNYVFAKSDYLRSNPGDQSSFPLVEYSGKTLVFTVLLIFYYQIARKKNTFPLS